MAAGWKERSRWGALGWLVCVLVCACSTKVESGQTVCTDPKTGQFVACPGTNICVDPLKGTVVACVSGDVTFGKQDADTSDSASAEVADSAVVDSVVDAAPDVAKDAADAVDAKPDAPPADTGPCQTGAKQCKDKQTLQTCTNGVWLLSTTCPSNQECHDGACGCPDPCKALGLVECLPDVAAVKTCQMNPDKCLSWGVPIACKPGEICENGVCKTGGTTTGCNPPCGSGYSCQGSTCVPNSTGGTLSCSQIVACSGNCAPGDQACKDDCTAQGSASGQGQFSAYQTCVTSICSSFANAGKTNDFMACVFSNCFSEQAACVGAGNSGCSQTNTCMGNCGTSASCVDGCNKAASKTGGLTYYTLYGCMDTNCAGLSGDGLVDCAKTQCTTSFVGCFSPINPGQTLFSCLDIANCQGKCGGDTLCAKACTAQGTPQAQADVNAFIDCRDLKCANACAASDSACMNCLQIYCFSQLNACSQ